MTMQRLGLMQEVPNRAKREAREAGAQARVERERTTLAVVQLAVQRDAALAWMATYYAERRVAQLAELERENQLLQATLDARIAAGRAMPAERTMARQEALALADRRDDALRDVAKARAAMRRWVGARADEALEGDAPALAVSAEHVRAACIVMPRSHRMRRSSARPRPSCEKPMPNNAVTGAGAVYSRRPQYGDMVSFQFTFDLPWQRDQRQKPQVLARQKDAERIEAEREDMTRRHREELETQLAELQALDNQLARLSGGGLSLAAERVALALASYEAGRSDLGAVLMARREALDTRLRLLDLETQRSALRVRLTTWWSSDHHEQNSHSTLVERGFGGRRHCSGLGPGVVAQWCRPCRTRRVGPVDARRCSIEPRRAQGAVLVRPDGADAEVRPAG